MPSSPRLSAPSMLTLRSPRTMSPAVGLRSPDRRLTSVDLPAPFGPITAWISPTARPSDTSFTAARPPKRFESAAVRIAISSIATRLLGKQARNQPLKSARERQHDRHDYEAFDQLPVLGQPFQRFLQPHDDDGSKQRPGDAALAAEHDHHQGNRRLVPAEHLGRHEAELRGSKVSGKTGERPGNDESGQPHAIDRK